MHFSVCFFCILLASESFVTTMPLPSVRTVLETHQIKNNTSEGFYAAPRIILPEGRIHDSAQNEGDYRNSLISDYHDSSNKAVRDDSASFSSLYLGSPKFKLDSPFKQSKERNVRKEEDYSSDHNSAFVRDTSTHDSTIPVNLLREPNAPMENSRVTIPLSDVKHIAHGTADLKNIPPIMPLELVQPVDDKLGKHYEEGQNTKERKLKGRQEHTSMDEVASGFAQQKTSQLNSQKKDEQHLLDEEEQERVPLHRKQRNTGVAWRKRDIPVPGYDTSGVLGEPEDDSLLPNDVLYGLETSTQYYVVPNPPGISYANGRDAYPDMGSINSLEVDEDDNYVPNLPLNSIQGNVAVQNYQQNDQPFQLSDPYDHNYQPLSSLTDSANDIPSNTYLTANSYQNEIMPNLPAQPSDYLMSSPDEDTVSFNKYLPENDNIEFYSQKVLPHVGEMKYLNENHGRDYEKKYSYNDGISNILNENDRNIYPELFRHNPYVGNNVVVSDLSDSFPSENMETEKQITYSNYKKKKNFLNNKNHGDYSSNREIQDKYVEGDSSIYNNRDNNADTKIPSSVEQRYSYNYPGSLREISDSKNYQGVSPQLLQNPVINKIELRDSDFFPPMNLRSHSKGDESFPSYRHFTSYVRPATMDSDLPKNSQYEFQKNTRKNLLKRYKNPKKYISVRRNSQILPYTQDNEYAKFHPRQYRTQNSMTDHDDTGSHSDNKNEQNTKHQKKLEDEPQMPHTNVSDDQKALKRHSAGETTASYNGRHSQKGIDVTFDPVKHNQFDEDTSLLDNMDENCLEEAESTTETEPTETTTFSLDIESTTEEDMEKKGKHKKHGNKSLETICKTDFPCSVNGVWYSNAGGVLLSLQTNKDSTLNVNILPTPSYYTGHGILSECWNITGEVPFNPRMKSFITLRAIECTEHKFATFIGECFTCEGEDVIYGSWLFGRPAHSCKDQHISTTEYKDIFRKSHLHNLGNNCKKLLRKPGV